MLRKAIAGFLSALLIGAGALVPGVVQAQAVSAPSDSSLLMGNIHSFGYTVNGDFGNVAGNSGGAWWGFGQSTEVALHNGTATTLWAYANCTQQGANGGTCGNGQTMYLALYVNGAIPSGGSCSLTYEDGGLSTVGQWDQCNITPTQINKGATYYITASVSMAAGQQNAHFGIGGDSSTSPNGVSLGCGLGNGGANPYGNPPTTLETSSSADCSGTGRGQVSVDKGLAATGTVTDVQGSGPAVGATTGANHTTSVAAHKVQFYRFQNVPGAIPAVGGGVSNLIEFFADSTTTETTGWNAAIYADSSGVPGSLIAECNFSGQANSDYPVRKGEWNFCTTTPVTLSPGNNYWIGIWNADGTNALVLDDQTNGSTTTECLTSSAQTTPFNPGSNFVTTGDATCTNKFGLVNAGPLT